MEHIQDDVEVLIFKKFEINLLVLCIEWPEKIELFNKIVFLSK